MCYSTDEHCLNELANVPVVEAAAAGAYTLDEMGQLRTDCFL